MSSSDAPPGVPPSTIFPTQSWTLDGYPIVDGKYHDLSTDEVKTHTAGDGMRGGPPSLSVYWNNRGTRGVSAPMGPDTFFAVGGMNRGPVTEYMVRLGQMLSGSRGRVTVYSVNATEFEVNVIVGTEMTGAEFTGLLREHKLLSS